MQVKKYWLLCDNKTITNVLLIALRFGEVCPIYMRKVLQPVI